MASRNVSLGMLMGVEACTPLPHEEILDAVEDALDLETQFLLELSRGLHGLVETETIFALKLHEVGIEGACWVVETVVLT